MSKGGPFSVVGALRPNRHYFNLSHTYSYTCSPGQIIPVLMQDCLPGDRFRIGNSVVVRTQPLVAPLMQQVTMRIEYFFCPNRLCWDQWNDFISGGKDGTFATTPPPFSGSTAYNLYAVGTLADYFGLPVGVSIAGQDCPDALAQIAYNKIWNEYYRDEDLQSERSIYATTIAQRSWRKDYFTSARLSQQRGIAPAIPMPSIEVVSDDFRDMMFPVTLQDPIENPDYTPYSTSSSSNDSSVSKMMQMDKSSLDFVNLGPLARANLAHTTEATWNGFSGTFDSLSAVDGHRGKPVVDRYRAISAGTPPTINSFDLGHAVDLSSLKTSARGIGFDVADFRKLFQVQKFLERNQRAGVRASEFLLAHFGIAPRDAVLQRPEYIGSCRFDVSVSEVLQTSQSTTGADGSPQGRLAGRGLGVCKDHVATYTCSEHGWLVGLATIMPSNMYDSQGVHKKFTRRSRYDYFFPEFAHLSEQPIKRKEIFASSVHADNEEIFGYQPIFQEYRHNRSMVVGELRPAGGSLPGWTVARSFASAPELNSEFITMDSGCMDSVFAVNNTAGFIVSFGNQLDSWRPIPVLGEPGLVDHF